MTFECKRPVEWALVNINCEPYEWTCEEDSDAHRAAIDILSTPPSTTALQDLITEVERRTIERCALVCEGIYTNGDGAEGWLEIAANKIRSLK